MSRKFYINGFSQAGAEHLAALVDLAYPNSNIVGPDTLSEQYQNSMAYIVHTMNQDPDAIFLISIREPLECLGAAILLASEGPKRIPRDISISMLIKLYNTFHWELLDRDRVILIPLDSILESPNRVLASLDIILEDLASNKIEMSDTEYLHCMETTLAGSWERSSVTKSYGWNDRYIKPIAQELNSQDYKTRIVLLNSLYSLLLSKSIGV